MAGNTVKDMTTNFGKLDKFEGHDFRRWHEKMHFLLTTLKVVYVLTTPMPELLEDATVEAIRIRAKWKNGDYICMGHLLNGMSDSLFDVYTNVKSAKELWDSLESKYMAEDSSSKKFLVSNFNNYKMVDSRPVMEQYNEILTILRQYTQHGLKMDESISVSIIIDKLPPSWKDFKHTLKHGKDDLSLVQLGSHLRIEESLRAQDSDKSNGKKQSNGNNSGSGSNKKPKLECWKCGKTGHFKRDCRSGKKNNANGGGSRKGSKDQSQDQDGSVLYMGDEHFAPVHGKGSVALEFKSGKTVTLFNVLYVPKLRKNLVSGPVLNKCGYKQVYESGHVHYKRMLEMSKDELIPAIDVKCTTCNKKYVITFIDDAYRFCYVYLLHAKDEALDKFRIYKTEVKLQQNDLIKTLRTYRGGEYYDPVFFQSVGVIHETTAPYTPQQNGMAKWKNKALRKWDDHSDDVPSESFEPRKGKRVQKAKSYGSDFQLYLVEGSRDQVGSQYSYCYSIKEDPRTYNEAMQSRDVALWKEAIDDEIRSIMENNTWVLSDLPPGCKPLGFRQKEGIDYFDTYAPVARITTIRLLLALAAIHNLVIHQMDVKTTFLNGDLDEEVYMKQPEGFVMPSNEHKMFDKTKKFLPSRFSMEDMGEAKVILGIKIKRENKGIVITQSHYIKKILKKFNREDCSSVRTPIDQVEKLKPNTGKPVDHLEYSRAIGFLMYAMTSTRPDIAYVVGRLSRFTSNPSRQH
nr:zinc finger, CCHC-type [Tanacetum cinerariifolium]